MDAGGIQGSDVVMFLFPLAIGLGLTGLLMAIREGGVGSAPRKETPVCGVKAKSQPPGWVFGLVWPILYTLLGMALALLWRAVGRMWVWPVFAVIIGVLGLQVWWIIFTAQCLPWGAFGFLIGLLIWFLYVAWVLMRYSVAASVLLLPLMAWLVFASYLSLEIAIGRTIPEPKPVAAAAATPASDTKDKK